MVEGDQKYVSGDISVLPSMRLSLLPSLFLSTTTDMKCVGPIYFDLILFEIMHPEPYDVI